jgi:hypothetical protein
MNLKDHVMPNAPGTSGNDEEAITCRHMRQSTAFK